MFKPTSRKRTKTLTENQLKDFQPLRQARDEFQQRQRAKFRAVYPLNRPLVRDDFHGEDKLQVVLFARAGDSWSEPQCDYITWEQYEQAGASWKVWAIVGDKDPNKLLSLAIRWMICNKK